MSVWFKPSEGADLGLIPQSLWEHDDLIRVTDEAEEEIIHFYTKEGSVRLKDRDGFTAGELYYYTENGAEYTVMLIGYHANPASAAGYSANRTEWSGFAASFRWTVANVVVHRLRRITGTPEIESERRGDRSWTYRESWTEKNKDERWPRYWNRLLKKYEPHRRSRVVWSV